MYCKLDLIEGEIYNDSNFFVRKVGRGSGVLERSLEIAAMVHEVRMCMLLLYAVKMKMKKFVITIVFLFMVTNVLVSADSDDDVVYDDKDLEGKRSSLSVLFVTVTF